MAFNYINSRGATYTLHEKTTTYFSGDLRRLYYFQNAESEGAVDELPPGFEIEEDDCGCPHLKPCDPAANGSWRIFGKHRLH